MLWRCVRPRPGGRGGTSIGQSLARNGEAWGRSKQYFFGENSTMALGMEFQEAQPTNSTGVRETPERKPKIKECNIVFNIIFRNFCPSPSTFP